MLLVSLITKTKRIAVRSAIVTHTHTHTLSHTDRQSTLDKYMIKKSTGWEGICHVSSSPFIPPTAVCAAI
jgi:hypothetical protein